MLRQRAGSGLQQALLQLSAWRVPASASSLSGRPCLGAQPPAAAAAAALPQPQPQHQQQWSAAAAAAAQEPQAAGLRALGGFATDSQPPPLTAASCSTSGARLQLPQLAGWRQTSQQQSAGPGPPVAASQHATCCSQLQPAQPLRLYSAWTQPGPAQQTRGFAAVLQQGRGQQAAALLIPTKQKPIATNQMRSFATAWQKGRAQQMANRRGGRAAMPEPPKKPRVNSEIDGPHVRLVFPDGTHKVRFWA